MASEVHHADMADGTLSSFSLLSLDPLILVFLWKDQALLCEKDHALPSENKGVITVITVVITVVITACDHTVITRKNFLRVITA